MLYKISGAIYRGVPAEVIVFPVGVILPRANDAIYKIVLVFYFNYISTILIFT